MNITLTIPDKHVPELLAVIASILNKPEPAHDTIPDHPELALDETSAEDDQTQQELPWDSSWTKIPPLPPLPAGKTKWVNRGTFENKYFPADGRYVFYLRQEGWARTISFSEEFHHIEAV